MHKKTIVILIFIISVFQTFSQDYQLSAGLRASLASGITGKYFFSKNEAAEAIISFRYHGVALTGLYELHTRAFELPKLNWYYGGGAHVGFLHGDSRYHYFDQDRNYNFIGVDGIIGLEYTIGEIPFNIGIDYKPSLNFIGYVGIIYDEFSVSIRYLIN